MYKEKKVLCIIPARGGSKSIKDKNIITLGNKPLIAYAVSAARKSKLLDEVIVSTDSLKIKNVALKYKVKVPFLRPKKYATNKSPTIESLKHGLLEMEKINKTKYDYVLCLQVTNPFVKAQNIDNLIKLIIEQKGDSATSVTKVEDFNPTKLKIIKNNKLEDYLIKEKQGTRRQDFTDLYKRNGSLYLSQRELIIKNKIFGKKIIPLVMSEYTQIDINTKFDLRLAEYLMKSYK